MAKKNQDNLRVFGEAPFTVVLVHGGPGAAGEMMPVAKELSKNMGVLEPLQTAMSVDGQMAELKSVLDDNNADGGVTLVGFSWGAWLCYLLAARWPGLVSKLILVSSGSFEAKYVAELHKTRMSRLSESERIEIESLVKILDDETIKNKENAFARFGQLFSKSDSFELIECDELEEVKVNCQADIYNNVWPIANELRRSGELLRLGMNITCPVLAIHGDYDPSPAAGVYEPLKTVVNDFRFELLEKCGHKPWSERHAKDRFYEILRSELK